MKPTEATVLTGNPGQARDLQCAPAPAQRSPFRLFPHRIVILPSPACRGSGAPYRSLGIEELGSILSCGRDASFIEGFNGEVALERKHTILQGSSACDFRFSKRPATQSSNEKQDSSLQTPGRPEEEHTDK
jgi:hypothetical protein